ncbi:hypothetical protein Skr01_63930 [Sphaerisporangium krabiense]|nr:hypothetical protein Skr01_63930 [Sphaerisporangium krabiense]
MGESKLHVRILGPLKLGGHEQPAFRSAKRRSTLAVLLINANVFVPLDRLAAEIWDDDPPATAEGLLRQYVFHLRRSLRERPGAAVRIDTGLAGYVLRVPPEEIDSHAFDHLVEQAKDDLAGGRPAEAAHALTTALRLWRGPALVDIPPTPSVTAEARRLEERRLAATELLMDIQVASGDHAMAVEQLQMLVARYPRREQLRELLMRAMYGNGRRAEALAVYQDGRQTLIDEVGIEPGPDLQRLHHKILADDNGIAPRRSPLVTRQRDRIDQLPPETADLAGRDGRRDHLVELIGEWARTPPGDRAAPRVVLLSGGAGSGKTALAIAVAHRVRHLFEDGNMVVPLTDGGVTTLPRALRALGAAPREVPGGGEDGFDLYRRAVADRRMLLILDDAWTEGDVRRWLPAEPGGVVIVTSRSLLTGLGGMARVACPPLGLGDGLDVLAGIVGADQVAAGWEHFRAVVRWCDGVPLALRAAGAALLRRRASPSDLLRRLHGARPLDELDHGELALRPRLRASVERLSPGERRLLHRLAAGHGRPDSEAAPPGVDRLLDLHLIEPDAAGGYRMNAWTRAYAVEAANTPEARAKL